MTPLKGKMINEQLVRDALEAVAEVFGDTSVPKSKTLENLEEIAEDVQVKIQTLKIDRGE